MRLLIPILLLPFALSLLAPAALAFHSPAAAAEAFLDAWQDKNEDALLACLSPTAREALAEDTDATEALTQPMALVDIREFTFAEEGAVISVREGEIPEGGIEADAEIGVTLRGAFNRDAYLRLLHDQGLAEAIAEGVTEEEYEQRWQMLQGFLDAMIEQQREAVNTRYFSEGGVRLHLVRIDGEWYIDAEEPVLTPDEEGDPEENQETVPDDNSPGGESE